MNLVYIGRERYIELNRVNFLESMGDEDGEKKVVKAKDTIDSTGSERVNSNTMILKKFFF